MTTLDYKEAAIFLHVAVGTLRKWVCEKKLNIPYHKAGSKVLFFQEELEEWLLKPEPNKN